LPYLFKIMPKYWAQIVSISDEAKLLAKVEAALAAQSLTAGEAATGVE
jgi:hypothetical protein